LTPPFFCFVSRLRWISRKNNKAASNRRTPDFLSPPVAAGRLYSLTDSMEPLRWRLRDRTIELGHRPLVMGIVNVTPDSFSDGGRFADADAAIRHGRALLDAGCGIVDVGGESTRPGAAPTGEAEELRRVVPVVRGLAGRGAAVSIDTRRAGVMRAAIDSGATIVNDVSALAGDPGSLAAVAASGASAILMHMRGDPPTMQRRPVYGHAPYEVLAYLRSRIRACGEAGIPASRLAIDPGIGFGKTPSHNAQLIAEGAILHDPDAPSSWGHRARASSPACRAARTPTRAFPAPSPRSPRRRRKASRSTACTTPPRRGRRSRS
jgi:dihydropteroate synthase